MGRYRFLGAVTRRFRCPARTRAAGGGRQPAAAVTGDRLRRPGIGGIRHIRHPFEVNGARQRWLPLPVPSRRSGTVPHARRHHTLRRRTAFAPTPPRRIGPGPRAPVDAKQSLAEREAALATATPRQCVRTARPQPLSQLHHRVPAPAEPAEDLRPRLVVLPPVERAGCPPARIVYIVVEPRMHTRQYRPRLAVPGIAADRAPPVPHRPGRHSDRARNRIDVHQLQRTDARVPRPPIRPTERANLHVRDGPVTARV